MTDPIQDALDEPGHQPGSDHGVSRRNLLTGLGAAAGAAAVLGGLSGAASAGGPLPAHPPHAEVLGANLPGLTYLPIDGLAFFPGTTANRVYQSTTGTRPAIDSFMYAPLMLPVGSVIRQIKAVYVEQPLLYIEKRSLTSPDSPTQVAGPLREGTGSNVNAQTFNLSAPVTIEADAAYTLKMFFSEGDALFALVVGYTPPLQGFVPYTGANPRVLDTRVTGGKLDANEDRVVSFAAFGSAGARSVLFNLAITETESVPTNPGGFVGAFSGSLATWPGNANINWFGADQNLSNAVTSALAADGSIKLHGGANRTHVVVDVVGYLH